MNAEYVHPLKQDLIQGFQEDFQKDSNILAVIVFGSGVEFRCNSYSDLDLLFERKDFNQYFHFNDRYLNELVDVLYADQIGEHLKTEIESIVSQRLCSFRYIRMELFISGVFKKIKMNNLEFYKKQDIPLDKLFRDCSEESCFQL